MVKDNETFITLIRVAQGDPDIRRQLITILSLDKSQREPVLHTFLDELKLKQKPHDFVAAVACLLGENVTEATLSLLRKKLSDDPELTESVGKQLIFAAKLLISIPATAAAFWFFVMGIFVGLELLGLTTAPIVGLPMAFLGVFIGAFMGGMYVVNRSWFLLVAIATADIVVALIVKFTEHGASNI